MTSDRGEGFIATVDISMVILRTEITGSHIKAPKDSYIASPDRGVFIILVCCSF